MTGREVDLRTARDEDARWSLTYMERARGFTVAVHKTVHIGRGTVLLVGFPGYTVALEVLSVDKVRQSWQTVTGDTMHLLTVEQVREGPQVPEEWVAPPQTHAPALVAQDARGPVEQGHPAANFCWV